MQVIYNSPSKKSLECSLDITFAIDNFTEEKQKRLAKLAKTTKISGFRPGKIPHSVLESKYGTEINWEISSEKMQEAYGKALDQEKLSPAGVGSFEKVNIDDPKNVSFTVKFEIVPDVTLANLSKVKMNRWVANVTEEEVNQLVERFQKQNSTWTEKPIESTSVEGDEVLIDFHGRLEDGTEFDGNKADNFRVVLGEKAMLPEFEEALYDCKLNESKKINFTFPDNYGEVSLQSKKVTFDITIKSIKSANLPELTDEEFIKKCGVPSGQLQDLRDKAKEQLKLQLQQQLDNRNTESLCEILLEKHELLVPNVAIAQEKKRMIKQTKENQKEKKEITEDELKEIDTKATRQCKMGYIFSEFTKTYSFKADQKFITQHLEQIALKYLNDISKVPMLRQNQSLINEAESNSIFNQIIEKFYELAQITDIEKTYKQLSE